MNNNNKNKNIVSDYSSHEDSKNKNPAYLRLNEWIEFESLRCYSESDVVLSGEEKYLNWMITLLKLYAFIVVVCIIVFT
jgi:hypothetical protein